MLPNRECSTWRLATALLIAGMFAGFARADPAPRYGAYIDGPWGQIHVRVEGESSQPTVVLVHQMVWSSEQFRFGQLALAQRGVRSIAIDIPGYGESDGPPTLPTAAQYAENLLPVLEYFGLHAANFLGTNTGAAFIAAFADAHPDRVKSLILEGPTIWSAADAAELLATEYGDQIPGADGRAVLNHRDAWFAHDAVFRFDLEPVLQRLKAPVMILTYPGQTLYRTALKVKESHPRFQLQVLDWNTRVPCFDNPDLWAQSVAAFIKQQQ
jgi:pimeloyl-ACP methyl ester carboxylesterase